MNTLERLLNAGLEIKRKRRNGVVTLKAITLNGTGYTKDFFIDKNGKVYQCNYIIEEKIYKNRYGREVIKTKLKYEKGKELSADEVIKEFLNMPIVENDKLMLKGA